MSPWWNPKLNKWSAAAVVLGIILLAVCRVATQKIWIVNELPVAVNVTVGDDVVHVEPHASTRCDAAATFTSSPG